MIKRLFWFLAVLLVTADSFLAADLLTSKISTKWEELTDSEVASDAQPKSKTAAVRYSDYAIIDRRNLFQTAGVEKQEEVAKSQEPKPPSEVKPLGPLKLKLLGTIVGTIARPCAIIQDLNTQKQDIYREGDTVTDAVVLKIYRNKVVLNHGGNEEILLAFESELPRSPREEKTPAVQKEPEQPNTTTGRYDLGRLGRRVSQYRWELDRSEVSRVIENASQLLTQVRIVPHFNKGQLDKPDGFQVANVKQGGFFDKLGIMPGDVIKEVNGEAVDSPEKAFAAYQKFKNESNVKIIIERQNQLHTLTYDIP
ncbi:MAG: type II secretion system protein GspC [bacterium]